MLKTIPPKITNSPVLYSDREVLFHLHPWQQELLLYSCHRDVFYNQGLNPPNYLSLLTGRQSGKSSALSAIIYALFYDPALKDRGIQVIYFCSTYSQVRDTIWEKLVDSL